MESSPLVIGKIPGYNDNINSKDNKLDYTNRLKNNLTMITLRPTGYTINFAGITGVSDSVTDVAKLKKAIDQVGSENGIASNFNPHTNLSELYRIGPDVQLGYDGISQKKDKKGTITTRSAVQNWMQLVRTNTKKGLNNTNGVGLEINELRILATNDSTMTEVFGNQFNKSTAEIIIDGIANNKFAQTAQKIKKGVTIDSTYGMNLLQVGTNDTLKDNQILSLLAGKVLGVQTAIPKEWFSSDYNNTLQVMVKLVSPSGDDAYINEYILKPLLFLMMAVSPITYDGINFGYPPLWEVEADGLMDIKLAGISAMTITRGGNDTQFNRYNQPLNVDVRLTIEPLINGFATSMLSDEYDGFLVTNPGRLKDSMSIMDGKTKKNPSYTTIKL